MATTSTDPREIEADLDRERAALASTLDTLSDRVSVDNLAKEALGMLKTHAGSATTSIDHAVRANPLARTAEDLARPVEVLAGERLDEAKASSLG